MAVRNLFGLVSLLSLAFASPPAPNSYWNINPPMNFHDALYGGLAQIRGVRNTLVYDGSAVGRTYAHHPHLHAVGNTVYLIHSSALVDEDSMGQETWTAVSFDAGYTWIKSQVLLPAAMLPNQTSQMTADYWCSLNVWQRALGALQIVQVGADVYGVAETADFLCSQRQGAGRIARLIDPKGNPAGDPCWVTQNKWTVEHDFKGTIYGTKYGMKYCKAAQAIEAILESPGQAPVWSSWLYNNQLYAADGEHSMQENTHALWIKDSSVSPGGGYWQRFWRDISGADIVTGRVWVEYTRDKLGRNWYPKLLESLGNKIYETNIPDATTKQFLGALDNGDRYLVHNPNYDPTCTGTCPRQPLVVSMSRGADLSYRWAGVLRTNAATNSAPGANKNHGFSYPSAIVVNGKLLTAYSENKENIWLIEVEHHPKPKNMHLQVPGCAGGRKFFDLVWGLL